MGFINALGQAYAHISRHAATGSPRYAHELNLPGLRFWPLTHYPHLVFYIELSLTFSTVEALDETIEELGLVLIDLPGPALFLAGEALVRYRRQGGTKSNVLGDFSIGAHAAVSGHPVLTRDTRRYAAYFPGVTLIAPSVST